MNPPPNLCLDTPTTVILHLKVLYPIQLSSSGISIPVPGAEGQAKVKALGLAVRFSESRKGSVGCKDDS